MKIIYKNKNTLNETLLYEEGGLVYYKKISLFGKTIHQIPIEGLVKDISFSRTYHTPFFIAPAYLSFLSIRLIIKKWNIGDWTLYLGLIVLFLISIGLIYYLAFGKKYGEVEIYFSDLKLPLYMTKKDYLELKARLSNLN